MKECELSVFLPGKLEAGLTEEEFKVLSKEVLLLAESAYRRGFHHGFLAGTGKGFKVPSENQVYKWRFKKYTRMEAPPGFGMRGSRALGDSHDARACTRSIQAMIDAL